MAMEKHHQWNLGYFVVAFVAMLLVQNWLGEYSAEAPIPYSEFQRLLDAGKVSDLRVDQERISGTLKEPIQGRTRFTTNRVEPQLAAELEKAQVDFSGVTQSGLAKLLGWLLPVLLFFGLWVFFFRGLAEKQGFGGMVSVGKSKARVFVERDSTHRTPTPYSLTSASRMSGASAGRSPTAPPATKTGKPVARATRAP